MCSPRSPMLSRCSPCGRGSSFCRRCCAPTTNASASSRPRAAVRSIAGAARAFFVDGGRVSVRLLDVVRTDPDGVVVAAAAKPGDVVVLDPPRELRDGDEVAP
jgi:hypothetical protein